VRVFINAVVVLIATSAGAADVDSTLQGKWLALEIRGRAVDSGERPWVQFHAGGQAGGYDGCNHFGATIALKGGYVGSKPQSLRQTLMACSGNKEAFTANLMVAKAYKVTGEVLILADEAGEPVLRLERAP
jgi:heat shock protein HslJ